MGLLSGLCLLSSGDGWARRSVLRFAFLIVSMLRLMQMPERGQSGHWTLRQRLVLESASFFLPVYVCVLSIFHYVPSFDAWCDGSSAVDAPPRTGFHGRLGTPVSPSRLFLTRDESHPVLLTYSGALTRWRSLSEGRTPSYSSRLPGLACNVPVEKADRHGPHTHEGKKRLYLGGGSCFRLLSDGGGEQWHARQSHARQMARLGSRHGGFEHRAVFGLATRLTGRALCMWEALRHLDGYGCCVSYLRAKTWTVCQS